MSVNSFKKSFKNVFKKAKDKTKLQNQKFLR